MKRLRQAALCFGLLVSDCVLAGFQTSSGTPRTNQKFEMTNVDLFSLHRWNSTQVEVDGFYLGMSRAGANSIAGNQRLQLLQVQGSPHQVNFVPCSNGQECGVFNAEKEQTGLSLLFDDRQRLKGIVIDCPQVRADYRDTVTRKFKGSTGQFFSDGSYSNGLRLKLFGPETDRESVEGRWGNTPGDTRYIYSKLGLVITVSPRRPGQSDSDLIGVLFTAPTPSAKR
jgi:hypothetical protein